VAGASPWRSGDIVEGIAAAAPHRNQSSSG
jgi:hypothetical protein